ncbi:hemolysin D [Amylibacter ulvae]|uniref:Hemolysin D n=2 Tax=Paramylibacter ulvae TaxID=1651968 RepID=A0ABQ3DAN6_9RHOB|nr:hemolysin D [Amylibacter ulvae]
MSDTENNKAQSLTFNDDAGSSRPKWLAGGIILLLVLWMGSGFIFPSKATEDVSDKDKAKKLVTVSVSNSSAEPVVQFFVAEGQAQPDRDTSLRSETSGNIAEILVQKGAMVKGGDVIARFDPAERASDLLRAQEELARAQREFDNSEALLKRGVATADRVASARATLASATAGVATAQNAINNTEISAPFDGRLETLDINIGEYVSAGADVARVVDNTPLTVSVRVPQQTLRKLKVGQEANVQFITGETRKGKVSFVGTSADAATRTFLAEISVENDDGEIPAGVSAEIRVPVSESVAHFMSPAILSLDTDGTLGVKTVDDANKVVFNKIEIVRAQTDGIWVTGLPDQAKIITIGQGYVANGDEINPQIDEPMQKSAISGETTRYAELNK